MVEASDDIFAQWDEDDTLLPTKLLPAIQQARGVYVPVRLLQYLGKNRQALEQVVSQCSR